MKTAPGHRALSLTTTSGSTPTSAPSLMRVCATKTTLDACLPTVYLHSRTHQLRPAPTISADPRFAGHSPMTLASSYPKPKSSKPSLRGHASHTLGCGCGSPAHSPRLYSTAPEKPPGRKTYVGRKCVGGIGQRCVIVYHVGGHALDGTT
jgi:hypothetical protein